MYNLMVSADPEAWLGEPFEIEKARCVSAGYTPEAVAQRYGALDEAACAQLQALPALFAYETPNKKAARLGVLKRVLTRQARKVEVRLEYEIFQDLPSIPPEAVLRLEWELGVTAWEMGTTHWAVKNCDLLHELQRAGLMTSEQAASYSARLAGSIGTKGVAAQAPSVNGASAGARPSRDTVFISYSHKDKKYLDDLLTHLKPLTRAGRVSHWSDKQIKPGSEWAAEIEAALKAARVAVLLVTKDFLASDFIHEHELGSLLKRAKEEGVVILWVLVRDCNWKKTPLSGLQAAYSTEKALAKLTWSRDEAWVAICDQIEKAAGAPPGAATQAPASPGLPPLKHDAQRPSPREQGQVKVESEVVKHPTEDSKNGEAEDGRADHRGFEGIGSRDEDLGSVPQARDQRDDVLQVEGQVRRHDGQRSSALAQS